MSATRQSHSSRRIAIGALALGLAVGGTGVAGASGWIGRSSQGEPFKADSDPAAAPGVYARDRDQVGQGLSSKESIERSVAGLEGTAVRSAQLVAAPEGYDSKLPWVGVQVDRTEPGLDETEAIWLAGLVQGAVADRMRTGQGRTSDVVGGGLLIDDEADSTQPAMDLGTGSIAGGQAFHSPEDEVLTGRARAAAATFGITLASVSVLHPLESALSATFVVPDDLEPTWTIDDLRAALEGASGDVEGTYVKLLAPDGSTLLSAGTSYRTGEGGLSFADGQDRRFGAVHGALGADSGSGDGTDGH